MIDMLFNGQVITNIDVVRENSDAGRSVKEQSGVTFNQINNVCLG